MVEWMIDCAAMSKLGLTSEQVKVICLGHQVMRVLDLVSESCGTFDWYGSDIEVVCPTGVPHKLRHNHSGLIGTFEELKMNVSVIGQFLSGVFSGVQPGSSLVQPNDLSMTEDYPNTFKWPIEIQIHMVDTTYISVFCEKPHACEQLRNAFESYGIQPYDHGRGGTDVC